MHGVISEGGDAGIASRFCLNISNTASAAVSTLIGSFSGLFSQYGVLSEAHLPAL